MMTEGNTFCEVLFSRLWLTREIPENKNSAKISTYTVWWSKLHHPVFSGKFHSMVDLSPHAYLLVTVWWFHVDLQSCTNVMWSSKMSRNSQVLFLRYSQPKPIITFVSYCLFNPSTVCIFGTNCPISEGFSPN